VSAHPSTEEAEMTAYTHTASRPRSGHLRAHLPAYLVGVGATAALTAGALVVFLSLATFVAFNGLPFGGSSDDVGSAYLDAGPSVAPAAAATALGAGPGAVAKDAATGSSGAGAADSATAAKAGSGGSGGVPSGGPAGKAPTETGASTSPGETAPPIAVPLPSTSGPVADAVQSIDNAAGTNLSGPAGGAAGAVDGAASQAGGAGGAGLGGRAGGAVNGVRDRVLGGARSAGSLLGR
jgi:hypothetical protein